MLNASRLRCFSLSMLVNVNQAEQYLCLVVFMPPKHTRVAATEQRKCELLAANLNNLRESHRGEREKWVCGFRAITISVSPTPSLTTNTAAALLILTSRSWKCADIFLRMAFLGVWVGCSEATTINVTPSNAPALYQSRFGHLFCQQYPRSFPRMAFLASGCG